MFNKPSRRKKLYAVVVDGQLIGVFPTKKMSRELTFSGVKEVIELFWTGGFYGKEEDTNSFRNLSYDNYESNFDF